MVMTDPIADLLTRIRNAGMARKEEVILPGSTVKERIAEILKREGYLAEVSAAGEGKGRTLTIRLKYGTTRQSSINGLERVSKPGRRVYAGKDEVPRVLGGLGIAILSTSQGILTDRQARKQGVGGEILAYIW
jgi:small subunit ribosomal protein S8